MDSHGSGCASASAAGNHLRSEWLRFAVVFGALALFFAAYATIEFRRYPVGLGRAVAIYLCLLLLVSFYLAPGFPSVRRCLSERLHGLRGASACVAIFLFPYVIYCVGTQDFRWWAFGKLFLLAAVPFGIFSVARVARPERMNWQDAVVLLWILVPVLFGQIAGIWNFPVNLDFMTRVFLVGVGSWSFLVIRGVEGSGYDFRFSRAILTDALIAFAGFAAIGNPLGFALHFTAWNPRFLGMDAFALDYVTIFLFVAVAEELFFRGLLQNLLEGSLRSRNAAQATASVIFGLSHIRHAPFPNWRYVTLATIAGGFYGWAYRRHRSLMASATTHALVDTLWRTWFTLPRVF